jgi:hypothetical protein
VAGIPGYEDSSSKVVVKFDSVMSRECLFMMVFAPWPELRLVSELLAKRASTRKR